MQEILSYFNWTALIISSIGTALVVVVANQTDKGASIHNAKIALGAAVLFSIFTTEWTGFFAHWQSIGLQFILTLLIASVIGFNQYQAVVDSFVGGVLKKAGVKKDGEQG